jgi:uncharacterized protein YbgA (DUF1722 family)
MICLPILSVAGTCLPIYGISVGELCESDDDCEAGLSCAYHVNHIVNPSAFHQQRQRSCQPIVREMMKKQYSKYWCEYQIELMSIWNLRSNQVKCKS